MPTPHARNDGLQLWLSGSQVGGLRIVGTIPGVVVTAASARNGPGLGLLTMSAGGLLSWQAPGSSAPGGGQIVSAGGNFMLEDGSDQSACVFVTTYPAYLPTTAQAGIELGDAYNNVGPSDVAAADALAGLVTITQYQLKNVSAITLSTVRLWLDATASGEAMLSVSSDGTNYYQPTSATDPNVLSWASIAAGATANVWVKRTIGAAASSSPSILNVLQWQWQGLN